MKSADWITDHCLLRYIERVLQVPVEQIRDAIAATPGLAEAARAGASRYSHDGFTFQLAPTGAVKTVAAGRTPTQFKRLGDGARGHVHKVSPSQNGSAGKGRQRNGGRYDRDLEAAE